VVVAVNRRFQSVWSIPLIKTVGRLNVCGRSIGVPTDERLTTMSKSIIFPDEVSVYCPDGRFDSPYSSRIILRVVDDANWKVLSVLADAPCMHDQKNYFDDFSARANLLNERFQSKSATLTYRAEVVDAKSGQRIVAVVAGLIFLV
jgi:hypothetical protein